MSQPEEKSQGDPWHAFGYITSGVACYGVLGWLADRWLGTSFVVAIGILVGAGLGIYMTVARFRDPEPPEAPEQGSPQQSQQHSSPPDPQDT